MNVKQASKDAGKKNLQKYNDERDFSKRETVVREVKKDSLVPPNNKNKLAYPAEENMKAGENARYLRIVMEFNSLPPVDLKSAEQVKNRIIDFYQICVDNDFKPTVSSLAGCLGLSRKELIAIVNDDTSVRYEHFQHLPTFARDWIKKAYYNQEQLWEAYMQNGKINPVTGIFLAKNNYGYVDKVEYTVESRAAVNDTEIENRYLLESDEL